MPLEIGILTTKLYRPRISGDLVPRARLVERLEARRDRPLTLVSAPAGYGKTTLVSSWLEVCDCPTAWLSLEAHKDWLPTILAAAGEPDVKKKLLQGHQAGDKSFKVHIDGYNLLPYLTGEEEKSPRPGFTYFSDDGDLTAMRYDNWKIVFMEQRTPGTLQIWAEPFVPLRLPKLLNLRTDPYERADVTSNTYYQWALERAYILVPAQSIVAEFLATFAEFPPRQKAASFSVDQVMAKLEAGITSA